MKGKLLSYEEVKNLPTDTRVYLQIDDNMLLPVISKGFDTFYVLDKNNNSQSNFVYVLARELMRVIKVYEWLEEPESEQTITKSEKEENTYNKTYKGSEILAMIEDGRLRDYDVETADGILLNKNNVYPIEFFTGNTFMIKQEPVDFMTAVNSGRYIRPVSYNKQVDFQSYRYWIDFLVTYKSWLKDPLDLINGLWEIEY